MESDLALIGFFGLGNLWFLAVKDKGRIGDEKRIQFPLAAQILIRFGFQIRILRTDYVHKADDCRKVYKNRTIHEESHSDDINLLLMSHLKRTT